MHRPGQIRLSLLGLALGLLAAAPADADWQPRKSIEFVSTAGGGGTDQFARTVQAIIVKHRLIEQPITVVNKPGGSGAEGYIYGKTSKGDPHKLIFGTSNERTLPMVAKMAFTHDEMTPIAGMALDEFLIWVGQDAPYKNVAEFIAAAKQPGGLKMGGSNSKDTDQTLTRLIEHATGAKFTYIPFKSGNEAAVQLAGGHIDSNTNNPAENIGQWRGGQGRPLCVFSPQRMPHTAKVTETQAWADIPTCKESGLPIDSFQQPRTVFLPGGVTQDQVAFYLALFTKVHDTPEWREYLARTAQTDWFVVGNDFARYIARDIGVQRKQIEAEGWLVN